ncbi:MAG: hypothetical protein RR766_07340, partial [Longicatena sp.]
MTIEQDKIVYNHILVRFGELSTKGKNKKDFIKRLLQNVKNALRDYEALTYERTHDRLYIMLNGEDHESVSKHLAKVFGISSFSFAIKVPSDIDEIIQTKVNSRIELISEVKENGIEIDGIEKMNELDIKKTVIKQN